MRIYFRIMLLTAMLFIIGLLSAEEIALNSFLYPLDGYRPDARKINTLKVYKDRLYIGFGDYGINTGDTDVVYYDFKTGEIKKVFTVQDEAIVRFCEIDSLLMIPGADATEDWSFGNMYIGDASDNWKKYRTIPKALHLFDITKYRDKLYISSGSALNFDDKNQIALGCVYSSSDSAKTWDISYCTPSDNNSVYRIDELLPYKGKLLGFVHSFYAGYKKDFPEHLRKNIDGDSMRVLNVLKSNIFGSADFLEFDGNNWTPVDVIPEKNLAFVKPVIFRDKLIFEVFSGEMVYGLNGKLPDVKSSLYLYDGEKCEIMPFRFNKLIDQAVYEDNLYFLALADSGYVVVEYDGAVKREILLPEKMNPLSIAIYKDEIYIGAMDGNIYKLALEDSLAKAVYPASCKWYSENPATDSHKIIFAVKRERISRDVAYRYQIDKDKLEIQTENLSEFVVDVKNLGFSENSKISLNINGKISELKLNKGTQTLNIKIKKQNLAVSQSRKALQDYKYEPVIIADLKSSYEPNSKVLTDLYRDVLLSTTGKDKGLYFKENLQFGFRKGKLSSTDIYRANYRNKIVVLHIDRKDIEFILRGEHRFSNEILANFNLDSLAETDNQIAMSDYMAEKISQLLNKKLMIEDSGVLTANAMLEYLLAHKGIE